MFPCYEIIEMYPKVLELSISIMFAFFYVTYGDLNEENDLQVLTAPLNVLNF